MNSFGVKYRKAFSEFDMKIIFFLTKLKDRVFYVKHRICGRHSYVVNDKRRLLEISRSQKLRFDSEKF